MQIITIWVVHFKGLNFCDSVGKLRQFHEFILLWYVV